MFCCYTIERLKYEIISKGFKWPPHLITSIVIYILTYLCQWIKIQNNHACRNISLINTSIVFKLIIIWLTDTMKTSIIFYNTILIQMLSMISMNEYSELTTNFLIQLVSILNLFPLNEQINASAEFMISILQLCLVFHYMYLTHKNHQKIASSKQTIFTKLTAAQSLEHTMIHCQQQQQPWTDIPWLSNQKILVMDSEMKLVELNFNLSNNLKSYHSLNDEEIFQQFLQCPILMTGIILKVTNQIHLESEVTVADLTKQMLQSEGFTNQFKTIQIQYSAFDFRNHIINCIPLKDNKGNRLLTLHFQFIEMKSEDDKFILNNVCKSISHELSTNLNCIMATSSEALKDEQLPSMIKIDYFQPINISVEQLALITGNIRDFGALETDQFQLKLVEFDIIQELSIVIRYFTQTAQAKGIQIHINHVDYQIFKYNQFEYQIFNDCDRFKQVFYQILSNAIRYTIEGIISIQVDQNNADGSYIVSVKDTGIGMVLYFLNNQSGEEQFNLRQVLQKNKLIQISTQSIGSSLGLFISNKIIKRMSDSKSSSLTFRSQINKGTKMTFTINNMIKYIRDKSKHSSIIVKGSINTIISENKIQSYFISSSQIQQSQSPSPQTNFDEDSGPHLAALIQNLNPTNYHFQPAPLNDKGIDRQCCSQILIVDDEYYNIFAIKTMLRRYNTICDQAFNGQEALTKIKSKLSNNCNVCKSNAYLLIFIDINMPIMDGFQTVKLIKQMVKELIIPKVRCIANTAFTDLETKLKAFESGMDDFLTKPISQDQIAKIIEVLFTQTQKTMLNSK